MLMAYPDFLQALQALLLLAQSWAVYADMADMCPPTSQHIFLTEICGHRCAACALSSLRRPLTIHAGHHTVCGHSQAYLPPLMAC